MLNLNIDALHILEEIDFKWSYKIWKKAMKMKKVKNLIEY